jgi:menaquinone-dependent protoporphyrinogen IX oxidase
MKIAVLFHSETGRTQRFAEGLADALMHKGHMVNSIKLQTTAPVQQAPVGKAQQIDFQNLPKLDEFELILWGGPVWALGPSPMIVEAIRQQSSLAGKTAIAFATMGFPFKFMGGNRALKYMNRELATKGAKVLPGKVCSHVLKHLEQEIDKAVEGIVESIQ